MTDDRMALTELRYLTELDTVDRPFVYIGRIVRDLGGGQEFTHMIERPSAEWRLPARLHPFPFEPTRVRGR
jgi:hypothetical protein